jgi:hypothetical protein
MSTVTILVLPLREEAVRRGRDYVVLERLRVMDTGGFGEPVARTVPRAEGLEERGGIT